MFIIYFPVLLVALQVIINLYALIDREGYNRYGFEINSFIGTNIGFAIYLVAFTWMFNFCAVSRASAVAELAFGINWFFVREDNLYNILFQIIVGLIALYLTYRYFIRKFPLCRISLLHKFFGAVFLTGSCYKGLDRFEREIQSIILKTSYRQDNGKHT